jgi:hypothetical protein
VDRWLEQVPGTRVHADLPAFVDHLLGTDASSVNSR